MDDYISREDAIEFVSSLNDSMSVCINKDECIGMKSMKSRAISAIRDVPAADVRENVRGAWIGWGDDDSMPACSRCRRTRQGSSLKYVRLYVPFCEKCGADMRT